MQPDTRRQRIVRDPEPPDHASDMPATSLPLVFDLDGTLVDPEWLG